MLIKIKLLKKTFDTNLTHLIPSPKDIRETIVGQLTSESKNKEVIDFYFSKTIPNFYIPNYTIKDGIASLEDSDIYLKYSATTNHETWLELQALLQGLRSFYGQPASWTLLDEREHKVLMNCFSYQEGIEVAGVFSTMHYLHNEPLPKSKVSFQMPQRIVLNIDKPAPKAEVLRFINSLHRRLVKLLPYNYQTKGSYMNELTGEEESLFINWVDNGTDEFTQVSIECPTGISDEVIEVLNKPFKGTFFDAQTTFTFTNESTEYFIEEEATHYKSTTPAFPTGKIKDNGNLKLTPAGNMLGSLNFVENPNDKTPLEYVQEGEWLRTNIKGIGGIKARTRPIETIVQSLRGGRRSYNGQAYEVELVLDEPKKLRSIGMNRRFGCGRLEAVKPL